MQYILEEIDKFLELYNLSKLKQNDTENLTSSKTLNKLRFI